MREKLSTLPLAELKALAKAQNIKGSSTMKKSDLIDALCAASEAAQAADTPKAGPAEKGGKAVKKAEKAGDEGRQASEGTSEGGAKEEGENSKEELDSGIVAHGILEVMADGYGFIRCENYLPGENDVYVAPSQIRRFGLKTGDIITGNTRIKTGGEKFSALLFVKSINGLTPAESAKRYNFEDMTPIFPNERIHLSFRLPRQERRLS